MTTLTFDKLSFVDKLKAGGFTEEQARTQADALGYSPQRYRCHTA